MLTHRPSWVLKPCGAYRDCRYSFTPARLDCLRRFFGSINIPRVPRDRIRLMLGSRSPRIQRGVQPPADWIRRMPASRLPCRVLTLGLIIRPIRVHVITAPAHLGDLPWVMCHRRGGEVERSVCRLAKARAASDPQPNRQLRRLRPRELRERVVQTLLQNAGW